ncbi:MAG TPA: hypothetical protein VF060_09315 [Trebonia sp.]
MDVPAGVPGAGVAGSVPRLLACRQKMIAVAALITSATVVAARDTRATAVAGPAPTEGDRSATSRISLKPAPAGASTMTNPTAKAKAKPPADSGRAAAGLAPTRTMSTQICRP